MSFEDDLRSVRDMVLEDRVEIRHLQAADNNLLARVDHEAEITHAFREKVQDQLSQDIGRASYQEKNATRVLRLVTIFGGTVGLISTIIVIIRTFA